jgi:hypothetical protein
MENAIPCVVHVYILCIDIPGYIIKIIWANNVMKGTSLLNNKYMKVTSDSVGS